MSDNKEKNIKELLFCQNCNFQATRPAEWLIHIDTEKHKRGGIKKIKDCTICNMTFTNHFAYKIHTLSQHATKEERSQYKYYCNVCDKVYISELYLLQHNKGKQHSNMIKTITSLKEMNII